MTFGEYRRSKPRINVLRGFQGNEPQSLTLNATPTADEGIMSGQVISINPSTGQWVLGCEQGRTPYIAYHDQADTDVVSSGLLLGLSCAGEFEIETGWFTDTTFVRDNALIADATTPGNVKKAGALASETADIIGFVSRGKNQVQGGRTSGPNSTVAFDPAKNVNSEFTLGATAASNSTLTFVTRWVPKTIAGS